ncbi:MAG: MBL fold metallo-hydrolase [Candidatus Micrarchaeaceae archaeon]
MDFGFVKWIDHAGFLIEAKSGKIAIDPFRVRAPDKIGKVDLIFVTHPHFDHMSEKDIGALSGKSTKIIAPKGALGTLKVKGMDALVVEPNKQYSISGIGFETVPAYNTNPDRLSYHPKSNGWVGYIINIDGYRIYHAGDTDFVEEMKNIKADLALIPIGGTYTMTVEEAIAASKEIDAKYFAPMHYKSLLGKAYAAAEDKFEKGVKNSTIFEQIQEPYYSF